MKNPTTLILTAVASLLIGVFMAMAQTTTSTGARTLKQSAIQRLAACEAQTSGKVATCINRARTAVERSIVWQGQDLFVTENFIVPPVDGGRVFSQEQTAVRWMDDARANSSTTLEMRTTLTGITADLVEADRLIAEHAIACAEADFWLSRSGTNDIAKAHAKYAEAGTNAPLASIAAYSEAWALAYRAMNASTEKEGLKWARKLYDPNAPRPEAIGRNGDIEKVSTNTAGRATVGTTDTEQWSGDNMAGTRSWAGNTLVGPPDQLFMVGLDYLDIREGGPLTNDMLGVWKYFPRQMQDAQFRFGFLEPDAAEVPVVHGVDFGLDGILPYNSIMVCLPFRLWLGSDDPVWQTGFYGGNPLGAGVWQVKAGETIRDAQKTLTNRIGTMDFLSDVTPLHMPGFKLQVGSNGAWQVLTDINRDGDVDIDTTSAMPGNRPSDYTNVSTHSGLWITTGAAGGVRSGRVGISPMTVSYDESEVEAVPAIPRNKRPLEVKIPAQSYVSPVPVEGKRWNAAYRVYATGSTIAASNEVNYLDTRAFITDIPLDTNGSTVVSFAQSGTPETVVTGSIAWLALDLAGLSSAEKYIVLRDGESLLLTVSGTGSVVTIDWDGDGVVDFTGRPGDKWVAKYTGGGVYEAIARIDGREVGSLAVQVNRVTFPVRAIAQVGRSRTVLVDLGVQQILANVRFTAADNTVLQVGVAVTNGHRVAVTVTPLKRGTPVLQARLYDGTLLGSFEVTEFTVENRNADTVIIDGDTRVGGSEIVIKPAIEKVGVRLKMFASQSTFAGGVTEFFVRSNEMKFEPDLISGETNMIAFYELEMPFGEVSSCYGTEIYDELEHPEYGSVVTRPPRFASGTPTTPPVPPSTPVLEPDSTEKSVYCNNTANPQPSIYKVQRVYMLQNATTNQNITFVRERHTCPTHSISITASSEPGTTPNLPYYDPATAVSCSIANGYVFPRTVKSLYNSLGFYDVHIGSTRFDKRVIVLPSPRLLAVTDFFTPRQQESPPYHVCKADYTMPSYSMFGGTANPTIEVKEHTASWSNPFYLHAFGAATTANTRLYNLLNRYGISGLFSPFYPSSDPIERVCWDGRKDANGDNVPDVDSDGKVIWADCPANVDAPKKEYDIRIRVNLSLPEGVTFTFCTSELISETCPLPRDANDEPCTGPAPYFGLFRDCVNSKYDALFLSANKMIPDSDGRPTPGVTCYYNGNHWWHTPMAFGWTHTFEMRMMPTRINGVRKLFFLGPGNHLFGPADSSGDMWIYGEKAKVVESAGEAGWTLTTREHTVYTFNGNGQLTEIKDRNDNTVTVTLENYYPPVWIERIKEVQGAGLTLKLDHDPALEYTRLINATLADRNVSFTYHEAPDQYATPYGPDEIVKTSNGPEYDRTFDVKQCRRRDPPSRVITGEVVTQKVDDITFVYDYSPSENLATIKSEAQVNAYKIGESGSWKNTSIGGSVATYDVGRTHTHTYTGNKLQKIHVMEGSASGTYTFNYNTVGQRIKESRPQGDLTFTYDGDGNLKKIEHPAGSPYQPVNFDYRACNQIARRYVDSPSREVVYTLDAKGNVTRKTERGDSDTGGDRAWNYTRNTDGSIDLETDPKGGTSKYNYDNSLGLASLITRTRSGKSVNLRDHTHNTFGNVTLDKDPKGNPTSYGYDKWDRRTKTTYANSEVEEWKYRPLNDLRWHRYPAGNATSGLFVQYSFTPSGKPASHSESGTAVADGFEYISVDDEGNIVTMKITTGGKIFNRSYTYDYADRRTSEKWDSTDAGKWKYDAYGNLTERTDGDSNTWVSEYYSANTLKRTTRPGTLGKFDYTRDGVGNITTETDDPAGSAMPVAVTQREYDRWNRVVQTTDPRGKIWKTEYDNLDNVTKTTDPKNQNNTYTYDGREYREGGTLRDGSNFTETRDDNSFRTQLNDPCGKNWSTTPDCFNQTKLFTPPAGGAITTDRNIFGTAYKYGIGSRYHNATLDARSRATSLLFPNGYSRGADFIFTGVTDATDRSGLKHTQEYADDGTINKITRDAGSGGRNIATTVKQDANLNIRETILPGATSTTGDTDRKRNVKLDGNHAPTQVDTYSTPPIATTRNGWALPESHTDPYVGETKMEYLADGLLKKLVVNPSCPTPRTTDYAYDDNGNAITIDLPGSAKIEQEFNARGAIVKRKTRLDSATRTENFTRDANQNITGHSISGTGNSKTFAYDDANRLTSILSPNWVRTFAYDIDGQITSDSIGGQTTAHVYNNEGWRTDTTVDGSGAFTFGYDEEGRLTSMTGPTVSHSYAYDSARHLKLYTVSGLPVGPLSIVYYPGSAGYAPSKTLPESISMELPVNDVDTVKSGKFAGKSVSFTLMDGVWPQVATRQSPVPSTYWTYNDHKEVTSIKHGASCEVTLTRDGDLGYINHRSLALLGGSFSDNYNHNADHWMTMEHRTDGSWVALYDYRDDGVRTRMTLNGRTAEYVSTSDGAVSGIRNALLGKKLRAPIGGNVYLVGPGGYPTVEDAISNGIVYDYGSTPFAVPAVIVITTSSYNMDIAVSPILGDLHPTAVNPLIIRGATDVRVSVNKTLSVSDMENVHLQGLRLCDTTSATAVEFVNAPGAALVSCLVEAGVRIAASADAAVIGNTFDYTNGLYKIELADCANATFRNNIYLNDGTLPGVSWDAGTAGTVDSDYNLYWPANGPVSEPNGLNLDPQLDAARYIVSYASPARNSGQPQAICLADLQGWYRHKTNPCRGALEYEIEVTGLDAAGRVNQRTIAGKQYTYKYDARGQLLEYRDIDNPANNAQYSYDAFGNRIRIETVFSTTWLMYEGGEVVAEYEDFGNDGTIDRRRVYWNMLDLDQRIGFVEIVGGTKIHYYYLCDQVGSVMQIVDSDGKVVNQYDYDAYGNIRWDHSFEKVWNRYTFQGREWDAGPDHYYHRNRTYIPEYGSFTGPDMNLSQGILGETLGLGSYTFCRNDPWNNTDPTGLEPKNEFQVVSMFLPELAPPPPQRQPAVIQNQRPTPCYVKEKDLSGGWTWRLQGTDYRVNSVDEAILPGVFAVETRPPTSDSFIDQWMYKASVYDELRSSKAQEYKTLAGGYYMFNALLIADGAYGGMKLLSTGGELAAKSEMISMYRGTTYYDALETVEANAFNIERIVQRQISAGHPLSRQGLFITSQESTAQYYADLAGIQGRAGGPAIVRIEMQRSELEIFLEEHSIPFEVPVPRPPLPNQTETLIPSSLGEKFNDLIDVSHH